MQKVEVGQETPSSLLKPPGLEGAASDQLVPLKCSAKARVWLVGFVYAPTATQLLELAHETE
jgi:hypothetical protein